VHGSGSVGRARGPLFASIVPRDSGPDSGLALIAHDRAASGVAPRTNLWAVGSPGFRLAVDSCLGVLVPIVSDGYPVSFVMMDETACEVQNGSSAVLDVATICGAEAGSMDFTDTLGISGKADADSQWPL
jgi:hypothetical protein